MSNIALIKYYEIAKRNTNLTNVEFRITSADLNGTKQGQYGVPKIDKPRYIITFTANEEFITTKSNIGNELKWELTFPEYQRDCIAIYLPINFAGFVKNHDDICLEYIAGGVLHTVGLDVKDIQQENHLFISGKRKPNGNTNVRIIINMDEITPELEEQLNNLFLYG